MDPLWLQGSTYAAREDRLLIAAVFGEGVLNVAGGELRVTQRVAGTNMSVDIAVGRAVIAGDQVADQNSYLVQSTAVENRTLNAADATNPRVDLVVARVRDAAVTGTANDWLLEVITGTPAVTPAVPAVPNDAIPLAEVAVAAGATTVGDANITDRRVQAVGTLPPGTHAHDHGLLTGLADDDHPQYVPKTLVDAKGDLLVGSAVDAVGRLAPSGVAGRVLTEDPVEPLGVKWATPGGGPNIEAKVTAGGAQTESVTWTTAFAAAPVVVASALDAETAVGYFVQVLSRSTTGASLRGWREDRTAFTGTKTVMARSAT